MQANKPKIKAPQARKDKGSANENAIHTLAWGAIIGIPVLVIIQVVFGG